MNNRGILLGVLLCCSLTAFDSITPYKLTEQEIAYIQHYGITSLEVNNYAIPASCRFTTPRREKGAPDIIYYLSKPKVVLYPIVVLCEGFTSPETIASVIHVHRYFLQECLDVGAALVTVEQQGVDGASVQEQEFMRHYTRSARLRDHRLVIEHIKQNWPHGWNGKFVFVGISEGGQLAMSLTTEYPKCTRAVMNICGACDEPWQEQVWNMYQDIQDHVPYLVKLRLKLPRWCPFAFDLPKNRAEYDQYMEKIRNNTSTDWYFLGMTYKYHADALSYQPPAYEKIKVPLLVVAGTKDRGIAASDAFVQKVEAAGVDVTYFRILDMDHAIRKRPDVIAQSFAWLRKQIGFLSNIRTQLSEF